MALRTLRLQLRFLLPLVLTLVLAATLAVPLMDEVTLRWFSRDLNSRGVLVASAMSDTVAQALMSHQVPRLQPLFDRTAQDERLFAIGLCSVDGKLLYRTGQFPRSLTCPASVELAQHPEPRLALEGGAVHIGVHNVFGQIPRPAPATPADGSATAEAATSTPASPQAALADSAPVALVGRLVLVHDMSFIDRRSQDTRRYLIVLITLLGLVIAVITMVVAQLSWRGWINGARALMRGEGILTPLLPPPELAPPGDRPACPVARSRR